MFFQLILWLVPVIAPLADKQETLLCFVRGDVYLESMSESYLRGGSTAMFCVSRGL